jgi:hypothetical protein
MSEQDQPNPTTALQPLPPAPDAGQVDSVGRRQLAALAELVELSNACDRTERSAEASATQRTAWVQRRYDRTADRVKQRSGQKRRDLKQRHQKRREQIEATFAQRRAKLDADAAKATGQLTGRAAEAEAKTRREMDHDKWVADSVLEGRLNQLRQEKQQDDERLEAIREAADDLDHRAEQMLARYRHGHLAPADLPPTDPPPLSESIEPVAKTQRRFELAPQQHDALRQGFRGIQKPILPLIFVGPVPYALWFAATIGLTVGAVLLGQQQGWPYAPPLVGGVAFLVGGGLVYGLGRLLFALTSRRIQRGLDLFNAARRQHHDDVQRTDAAVRAKFDRRAETARAERDAAHAAVDARFQPMLDQLLAQSDRSATGLTDKIATRRQRIDTEYQQTTSTFEAEAAAALDAVKQRKARRLNVAERRRDRDLDANRTDRENRFAALQKRWDEGRARVLQSLDEMRELERTSNRPWDDPAWADWQPPTEPAPAVRFGTLHLDVASLIDAQATGGRFDLSLPPSLQVPALLSGPDQRSLAVAADPERRDEGLKLLNAVVLRLLTTLPPGRAKFTLIDPVGLGESFGALMHLADHEDSLVNGRVWSEPMHIDRRLADLTDHMGQMIQKYLRNDYASIDAYNAQAGELAEPYRFLVVADYPQNFSADAAARLHSIAASGARSGVFVLVLHDPKQSPPAGTIDDLTRHCTVVRHEPDDGWRWRHPVTQRFPFVPDQPPGEALATQLLSKVGRAAIDAGRVQVPFHTITPDDSERWSADAAEDLVVPIGRAGATRLQRFRLGHGVAQHALVAGKTGSGKSSLLHTLIANLCLWYPPDQLELYLIDFKKGVEFKPYVQQRPPQLRAVAIESDREFGLSILKRLDAMLDERGEKFRAAGVANLSGYHTAKPNDPMPRVLLVVDEFQELFSQDDAIAQNATLLLDRLVRQGRAFGMHAFLGSQSLSGAAGLPRGTMGQMAVRIALQCSENDSQLILGDENTAARLLTRPGEAIYNDQGGSLEANSLFQVAWLPDHELRATLDRIAELRQDRDAPPPPCFVFEGNAPASLADNEPLNRLLASGGPAAGASPPGHVRAYLGEPIAIDDPVALSFARISGANAVILGQNAEATLGLLASALLTLAAALPPDRARFVVLNGSTEPEHDEALRGTLAPLPHRVDLVPFRDVDETIADLHAEMQTRLDTPGGGGGDTSGGEATVFLAIAGLQRFRQFRQSEDSFSFSLDDDPGSGGAPGKPDAQLRDLLRDGPAVGIHLLAACDRAASLEQVFDRRSLREFDHRVMFQMSANDSAQLIDSSDANDLGPHRALLYREDRGTVSRFRPYGLPTQQDVTRLIGALPSNEKTQGKLAADERR